MLRFRRELLCQLFEWSILYALRLAMVHARWKLALAGAIDTQVALIGRYGHVRVLPHFGCIFPRTNFRQLDAPLIRRKSMLHLTSDFASVTSRAPLVVYEKSILSHDYSPSSTL